MNKLRDMLLRSTVQGDKEVSIQTNAFVGVVKPVSYNNLYYDSHTTYKYTPISCIWPISSMSQGEIERFKLTFA